MLLFHGSDHILETPQYGEGKKNNDFGCGFYCTENSSMAKEWGVAYDHDGYANAYELDPRGLAFLHLNRHGVCLLHWLSMLLENRHFDVTSPLAKEAKNYILDSFYLDYKSYDVIIGYRADDSYFSFASDFLNGTISYRQLGEAMKLGKLGQQVVLKSKKSFSQLHFIGYEEALRSEWLERKILRDRNAREKYLHEERFHRVRGDLYITQILDEEMKADDPRLQ